MTRITFSSSAISASLFCRRPAVSMRSTSACASRAAVSASKARPAASAPCAPETTRAPVRSPQIFNCSIAAARKVSPAASTTDLPSARSLAASLPMVVVLPVPLTPTTSTTCGFSAGSMASGMATGASTFVDLVGEHLLDLVLADLLVEAAGAERRRRSSRRSRRRDRP